MDWSFYKDIPQAGAMLSHLLPRQQQNQESHSHHISAMARPISVPYKNQEYQEFVPIANQVDDEVLLTNQVNLLRIFSCFTYILQPYRTTPLVLPHAKTIHDMGETGNNLISTTKKPQADKVHLIGERCIKEQCLKCVQSINYFIF